MPFEDRGDCKTVDRYTFFVSFVFERMESIYNLVPREYVEPPKAPMHRSHHDPLQNLTGSTFGCRGSTRLPGAGVVDKREGSLFGPHKTLPPYKSTTNRLTKSGANTLSGSGEFRCEGERKPAVPKRTERPVLGITSNKNYITANAVEAILMGKLHFFLCIFYADRRSLHQLPRIQLNRS
jgi:hypothetical protein